MSANISFRFHNNGVVQAGGVLTGEVVVSVRSKIDFCSVEVHFIGVEGSFRVRNNLLTPYPADDFTRARRITFQECYHHKDKLLIAPGTPGFHHHPNAVSKLEIGTYVIPFAVTIPKNVPASLNMVTGYRTVYVNYYADAKINTKNTVSDFFGNNFANMQYRFKVIGGHNDALFHQHSQPIHLHNEKSFLFDSGELKLKASLPRSAFFIGESIPLSLLITNETSKNVDDIRVTLNQFIEAYYPLTLTTPTVITLINHSTKTQIHPKSKDISMGLALQLPNASPATYALSKFSIYYSIEVTLVVSGFALNLSLVIPIILMHPPAVVYQAQPVLQLQPQPQPQIVPQYYQPQMIMMNSPIPQPQPSPYGVNNTNAVQCSLKSDNDDVYTSSYSHSLSSS